MAGGGQRDAAIALKDTFGKAADDITSKAGDFHDITANNALDGARAFADTDGRLGTTFDGMGDGEPQVPDPDPNSGPSSSGGEGGGSPAGPVSDDFQGTGQEGGQGAEGVENTPSCKDPIDPVSGQMMVSKADVDLPGVLPLLLRRAYASDYRHGALFGPGWSSTLDQRLVIDEDGIHLLGDDAQTLNYPVPTQPGQRVLPAAGARWPLSWDRKADAVSVFDPASGITRHFAPPPAPVTVDRPGAREVRRLTRITDRNGNWLTVTCDADNVPTRIDHSGGYRIAVDSSFRGGGFRVDALRLVDAARPDGTALTRYVYDPAGRLVEILDARDAALVYEYDGANRITAWIDQAGYRYDYHYDEHGRVAAVGGEDGTLAARFEYDREARRTRVTDGHGAVTEYRFDEFNHLTAVADPLGNVTVTAYDRYGRLLEHTDALGNTTRIDRDEAGNERRFVQPDGSYVEAEYDTAGQPVRVVSAGGAVSLFEYDERGNVVCATDPSGAATRYAYDDRGALATVTDPAGQTTSLVSDRAGLPVAITDPLNAMWRMERDSSGRVIRSVDPLGNVTETEYDGDGRAVARTNPDGGREAWAYDLRGNMVCHTNEAGFETKFGYGPFRTVRSRIDPDGSRYEFAHDLELRLTRVVGPTQASWSYAYDAAGNLTSETDFNGRRLAYAHDAAGRLVRRTNGAGQSVELARNTLGQVFEQRTEDGSTTFSYDADWQLAQARSQATTLEYSRDLLGRIIGETVDGRTLSTTYDALGQRVRRTTPSGRASAWRYDAAGRPILLDAGGQQISFGHDAAGRESYRWLSPTTALTNEWDRRGRLTARRLLNVAGSENERTSSELFERTWTYRADGNPESITDTSDGVRRLGLDPLGRVVSVVAAGWNEQYAYDAVGNLTQSTDSRTPDADAAGPRELTGTLLRRAGRTTYEYDGQGRLVRVIRRTLSGGRKAWGYAYDAHDRLTEATTPDGLHWRYRYDPLGRRVSKQLLGRDGEVLEQTRFAWDGAVLAEQEHLAAGGTRVIATVWDYEPDSWTPLVQDSRTFDAGTPQELIDRRFHAVITDLVGAPTELITADGVIAWRASNTAWGYAVPTAQGPDAPNCPLRFPGQYHDPETGLHYNLHRYYDPQTGRYTAPDPLGLGPSPNHHGYVPTPLTRIDPLGLADKPINWNSNSVKTFGHVFSQHGQGAKNLRDLTGRAASTGDEQGQWLDDEKAAQLLKEHWDPANLEARTIDIPPGLGQVIKPDGSIVPATKAKIVPRKPNGIYKTGYPISCPE